MGNEQQSGGVPPNGALRESLPDRHARRSAAPAPGSTQVDPKPAAAEPLAFEEALGRLDELVTVLEEGGTPLEEALALYEEGVRMAEYCQRMLDEAELRLQRLVVASDGSHPGSYALESFTLEEDE